MPGCIKGQSSQYESNSYFLSPKQNIIDQDNERPFAIVPNPIPEGYCGKKPVTIKFKVCNRNDTPIKITDKTWIKYNKEKSTWDESKKWLAADTCKVITITDEWDRCEIARGGKSSSRLMEAQLAARIINDPKDWSNTGPNAYCYCYLFKASRVEIAELPPPPAEEETKPPVPDVRNQTVAEPTSAPVASPSKGKGKNSPKTRRVRRNQ